ncbi:hypothetical protein GW17_00014025 [Ensete ventricosum]|nr:hypothetical protein GW17_00014025 [Ensete ventricosum]
MCGYSAGFGWSWGPLSWIIPSEIFPVEIRSAGQSISVAINLGLTFVQTQTFLAMLCRFKQGTFAFYAAWVVVMTAFVAFLLPETKGVPLEFMSELWRRHWYWGRFLVDEREHKIAFRTVAKGRIAGGGFMADGSTVDSGGRQTASVIITCVMAASGGLIFWLTHGDFRVCLIACRRPYYEGRWMPKGQSVMLLGGVTFLVGMAIDAAVVNIEMLILGRLLLGVGVGFINQTASTKWRGVITTGVQLFIAIGVVVAANVTNYGTSHISTRGWRPCPPLGSSRPRSSGGYPVGGTEHQRGRQPVHHRPSSPCCAASSMAPSSSTLPGSWL